MKISSSADGESRAEKLWREYADKSQDLIGRENFAWGDMMNISPSIGKILNRYGCDVTVKNGGKSVRTKAFISPLRYNSNQNYDSVRHKLGMRKTKLFYLLHRPMFCLIRKKRNRK